MVFNSRCACNVAEFSDDQYVHQKEKEVSANGIEEFPVWRINNALQKYIMAAGFCTTLSEDSQLQSTYYVVLKHILRYLKHIFRYLKWYISWYCRLRLYQDPGGVALS